MSISREVLGKYIKRGCLFVETGSRWADTCIKAVELGAHFAESCEVDPIMAAIAQLHANDATRGNYVRVNHVKSVAMLSNYGLEVIDHSDTVVFLDAHTDTYSPVLEELAAIKTWKSKPRYILIDDLRYMRTWCVDNEFIADMLREMGYSISYEDGVVPVDIMVGMRA